MRLNERSDWDHLKELFTIKSFGGHNGTELLAAMKQLAPQDNSLWLRYLFYSCLPNSLQVLGAKENGTVEQLAARLDEHLRKRPGTAAGAPIAAATQEEVVAAATQNRSHRKRATEPRGSGHRTAPAATAVAASPRSQEESHGSRQACADSIGGTGTTPGTAAWSPAPASRKTRQPDAAQRCRRRDAGHSSGPAYGKVLPSRHRCIILPGASDPPAEEPRLIDPNSF